MKEIEDGKGQRFLAEALQAYQKLGNGSDLNGRNGYRIGSDSYMHALERDVFGCNVPTSYSADWGNPQYAKLLREALAEISSQIEHHLEEALRGNCYMRDENAERMREAVWNLEKCGISTFSYSGIADKLCWYVGGDEYKIRQLQQKLNDMGVTDRLTEDGVYGTAPCRRWLGQTGCKQTRQELESERQRMADAMDCQTPSCLKAHHTFVLIHRTTVRVII